MVQTRFVILYFIKEIFPLATVARAVAISMFSKMKRKAISNYILQLPCTLCPMLLVLFLCDILVVLNKVECEYKLVLNLQTSSLSLYYRCPNSRCGRFIHQVQVFKNRYSFCCYRLVWLSNLTSNVYFNIYCFKKIKTYY